MANTPTKRKLPRAAKIGIWIAALAVAYTVVGFLIVPAIIKSQLIKRLPPLTHRQAVVRQVLFNPYTLALTTRGLALTETNGEAFAGFDELHVQFQAMSSLFHQAWVFKDITVRDPFAQVSRFHNGQFNFDNLLQTRAQTNGASGPSALPAVMVESLRIDGASVAFDDLANATAFQHKVAPVDLLVTNFTTKSNITAAYTFSAVTDGAENFATFGNLTVQPFHLSGSVKIDALDLKSYGPYLAAFTTAEVLDGKFGAGAEYQITPSFDVTVTNANAKLTGLRVKAPDASEPILTIPSLSVESADVRLFDRRARVRTVKSTGGLLAARRDHDGGINLLALVKNSTATATSAPGKPWAAQVDEIVFDDYAVQVEDRVPTQPVKVALQKLAFKANGLNTASNAPVSLSLSTQVNEKGTLAVDGTVTLFPVSADLKVDLAGLELPPFQPYLADQVRVSIVSGQIDLHGRARYMEGPLASFRGDFGLTNFASADATHYRELAKIKGMAVSGIDFEFEPNKLHIDQINLTGLHTAVVVETNRALNFLSVIPPRTTTSTPSPSTTPAQVFPASLDALVLENASLHVVDESVQPNCVFDVQELDGTIKGLSSQAKNPSAVDLHGNVDQFSPFTVSGSADPLSTNLTLNLALSFKNLDLTTFTPYMEKYGGYPLNKGKLMLDLKYDITHRKLVAANKVEIANLTLGAKNSSPDAVHLPIKLGIALLQDRDGKINLDIPLAGSLDDPSFRIGPIFWKIVHNLMDKVISSPFSILGALLGGGGEELSYVEFSPGSSIVAPGQQPKIEKLVKALYARPALDLQIAGDASSAVDGPAIARAHLERRVKAARARELASAGKPADSVDSIQLAPEDYARLVQEMYNRTLSTNSTPHPPAEVSKAGEAVMRQPTAGPDVAQMAGALAAKIPVTDDELLELMKARAQAVQAMLMESGKVPADHVFVVAPKKPMNGQARANFTLE